MSVSMVVLTLINTISQFSLLSTSTDIYQGQVWTECQGTFIVGGFGNFGKGAIVQHTYTLPHHQIVRITAKILLLDSWDSETLTVSVDGVPVQTFSKGAYEDTDICGALFYAEKWFDLDWQGSHSGTSMIVKFSSNLDEDASNESWGFTDFSIQYDNSCIHLYSECDFQGTEYFFCPSLPQESSKRFIDQIRSMQVPNGMNIQLQDSKFENGNLITFTSDQNCINPFYFPKRVFVP